MALVTRLISGFYVDGICEVFAVYNDVTHLLKTIVVKGSMDRVVDIEIQGETLEIERQQPLESVELKFDISRRNIRYFIPTDDTTKNETPPIICTYYAQKLSRADVTANKLDELIK